MSIVFWKSAGVRALKTALQTILGVWTAGTVITSIDWKATLVAALSAFVYSILTSVATGLPEVAAEDVDWEEDDDEEDDETEADLEGDEE